MNHFILYIFQSQLLAPDIIVINYHLKLSQAHNVHLQK
jgi:hypothetical protein